MLKLITIIVALTFINPSLPDPVKPKGYKSEQSYTFWTITGAKYKGYRCKRGRVFDKLYLCLAEARRLYKEGKRGRTKDPKDSGIVGRIAGYKYHCKQGKKMPKICGENL